MLQNRLYVERQAPQIDFISLADNSDDDEDQDVIVFKSRMLTEKIHVVPPPSRAWKRPAAPPRLRVASTCTSCGSGFERLPHLTEQELCLSCSSLPTDDNDVPDWNDVEKAFDAAWFDSRIDECNWVIPETPEAARPNKRPREGVK
jgi:hypothetical protein